MLVAIAAMPAAWAQEAAPDAPATAPVATQVAPATQSSAAADAAWADLQLLREYIHASRRRAQPGHPQEFPKVRKDLIDAAYLGQQASPQTVEQVATLWPSVVSHYVDGFQRGNLVVRQPNDQQAIATIAAVNPNDRQVADEVSLEVRKTLQEQGFSGQDLREREVVLVKRELAQRGIGYPLVATIQMRLTKVNGQWKMSGVSLLPPLNVVTSHPVSRPRPIGVTSQLAPSGAATQPGQ